MPILAGRRAGMSITKGTLTMPSKSPGPVGLNAARSGKRISRAYISTAKSWNG
jgi:hypothetical protein